MTSQTVTVTGMLRGERIFRDRLVEITRVYDGEEDFIPEDEATGRPAQSRIFVRHHTGGAVPVLIVKGSIRAAAEVTR